MTYKIEIDRDGNHYAVFKNGVEAKMAKADFEGCYIHSFGGYENAYFLTSEWFCRSGRPKSENEIGF